MKLLNLRAVSFLGSDSGKTQMKEKSAAQVILPASVSPIQFGRPTVGSLSCPMSSSMVYGIKFLKSTI